MKKKDQVNESDDRRKEKSGLASGKTISISLPAKLMLAERDPDKKELPFFKKNGLRKIMVGGVIVSPEDILGKHGENYQLWECDIIIMPKRKLGGFVYNGALFEDALSEGLSGDPKKWKTEIIDD